MWICLFSNGLLSEPSIPGQQGSFKEKLLHQFGFLDTFLGRGVWFILYALPLARTPPPFPPPTRICFHARTPRADTATHSSAYLLIHPALCDGTVPTCLQLRLPSPNFRPCTLASLGLSAAAACASFRSATPSASPPGFSRSSSASARSSCTSSCRPTSRTHARS